MVFESSVVVAIETPPSGVGWADAGIEVESGQGIIAKPS
jgi:hypothetical protein